MLHVISNKMAEFKSPGPSISPFTRRLKYIALNLTNDDFSTLKLVVQSDDILKKQVLDELKNPQDLLRILQGRSLIHRGNTQLLFCLLEEIGRKDLAKLLVEPDICSDGVEESPTVPEDNTCTSSQMSVDDIDDDEIIMSSQGSISDEEKLMLKKMSDCE